MPKPWSKLQKEFYLLRADNLDFQIHCRSYRMKSQRGNTNLPRYWISLGKEIIWDYPKDFIEKPHSDRVDITYYPYGNDIPDISNLIRDYIDTSKQNILSKKFSQDFWGLTDILKAADKRIGIRRLASLYDICNSDAAKKVINIRLKSNPT